MTKGFIIQSNCEQEPLEAEDQSPRFSAAMQLIRERNLHVGVCWFTVLENYDNKNISAQKKKKKVILIIFCIRKYKVYFKIIKIISMTIKIIHPKINK